MFRISPKFAFTLFLFFSISAAKAQVDINGLGQINAYQQDFNLLGTANVAWSNNATVPGWYADRTAGSLTSLNASPGNTTTGGFYNFGSTGHADRALGSIGSGPTGDISWGVRMRNTTSVTITAFAVSFTGEQWRNSKAGSQAVTFSYRTSNTAITSVAPNSGTWMAVPALDFNSPVYGGTVGAINGNLAANRITVMYTITGISLAPGAEIMFRWTDINHRSNDHGLAIDDVSIAALTPNQFYSKSTGHLNDLTTWGRQLDGSGVGPVSFSDAGQIFNIRNSATKTISGDWDVRGFGSKVILDNSGSAINFTIPANFYMAGILDVLPASTLTINNQLCPDLGAIDLNSTVIFGSGNQLVEGNTYGNLTIAGGGDKTLQGQVSVRGSLTFVSGALNLGDQNLELPAGSTVSGANEANYVKTSGIGSLVRPVTRGTTTIFPVGCSNFFNPVTISLTNSSTSDNFYVSAMPRLYTNYDDTFMPLGSEVNQSAISKYWIIEEEIAGGSNATVQLQWNVNEEQLDFNRLRAAIATYLNDTWTTNPISPIAGTDPFTTSLSGVTSFAVFTVAGENAPLRMAALPVELLFFNVAAKNQHSFLKWATATELNNQKFVVERSENGHNWKAIGEVAGKGTTNTRSDYTFTDLALPAAQQVYYRLKQVDLDGTFTFSKMEVVAPGKNPVKPVSLKTNPVKDQLVFELNGTAIQGAELVIYTNTGQVIYTTTLPTEGKVSVQHLPAGYYVYRLMNQQEVLGSGRMVKVN